MLALTLEVLGRKPNAQAFESTFAAVPCSHGWSLRICQTPCGSWTDRSFERLLSCSCTFSESLRKQSCEYLFLQLLHAMYLSISHCAQRSRLSTHSL